MRPDRSRLRRLVRIAAATALLAVPTSAGANVIHFAGHATGPRPDTNMRIAFDVVAARGRPQTIRNIRVTRLDYRCEFTGPLERDLRIPGSARFARNGKFALTERNPPPDYFNDISGRFRFPKRPARPGPTITGYLTSEVGYGRTRSTYNCLASEFFVATPRP
jgi:hypothetical protein